MQEIAIAAGILGLLTLGFFHKLFFQWDFLLQLGGCIILAGLALGVPTGFYYHLLLRQKLKKLGPLPKGWWVFPIKHHAVLAEEDLGSFQPWFKLGAIGFFISIGGCAMVVLGLLSYVR